MQILKKIIVFLITITISAIVFLLSPSDMFVPVLGLVSATAMVGVCTNTILLKIFGTGDQIKPENIYTQEEFDQKHYAEQETGNKEKEEPSEGSAQFDGVYEQPQQQSFSKFSEDESKNVRFSEEIADIREFIPDTPRRKKHRKRDAAITEFENALTTDSGVTEEPSTKSYDGTPSITEPEQPIVEQSVPMLDGPPIVEDIQEGESETSTETGTSQKKSRRSRR